MTDLTAPDCRPALAGSAHNRPSAWRRLLWRLMTCLACLLPVQLALATEQVTRIYGTAWGPTLANDGSGFYSDLVRLVLDGAGGDAAYIPRPYRRAKLLFYRDKDSCLFPSNIPLLLKGGEIESADGLVDSAPFLSVKVFVFSAPGTGPVRGIEDINGKSMAYAMGSRVPHFLSAAKNTNFIAVSDEVDKARMLLTGRVDLMTAAVPDAVFVFRSLGEEMPPFDPAYLLNDTQISITCFSTPQNLDFIRRFNGRIAQLMSGGQLLRFFLKHDLDPAIYLPAARRENSTLAAP